MTNTTQGKKQQKTRFSDAEITKIKEENQRKKIDILKAMRSAPDVSDGAYRVATALAFDHMNDLTLRCDMSHKTLGKECGGMAPRTVQRHLDNLRTYGWLTWAKHPTKVTNDYTFNFEKAIIQNNNGALNKRMVAQLNLPDNFLDLSRAQQIAALEETKILPADFFEMQRLDQESCIKNARLDAVDDANLVAYEAHYAQYEPCFDDIELDLKTIPAHIAAYTPDLSYMPPDCSHDAPDMAMNDQDILETCLG